MDPSLGLQPLIMTPEIAARARQQQPQQEQSAQQPSQWVPPPDPQPTEATPEPVLQLQAMFPDLDREVLECVLSSCNGSLEAAISQLLEMSDPEASGNGGDVGDTFESDEQLALALFHQFADDLEQQLGEPIPPEVRADSERYEAFVRAHFDRALSQQDSSLVQNAEIAIQQNEGLQQRGGRAGFLERLKRMPLRTSRVHMISVEDKKAPLLKQEDHL